LVAVISGNMELNGQPEYMQDTWISMGEMSQFPRGKEWMNPHVQPGEDSLFAQQSLVKQALVAQGIQAADLKVRWGEAIVVGEQRGEFRICGRASEAI
jgi:hypothetical protein